MGILPEKSPYKLGDGAGLYIQIMPKGGKYWRLAYRFAGKQKTLALGTYPDVKLVAAKKKRLRNPILFFTGHRSISSVADQWLTTI